MILIRGFPLLPLAAALVLAPVSSRGQEEGEWRTIYDGPKEAAHAAALRPEDLLSVFARVRFSGWGGERPGVDFSQRMVVGICLGTRPTGGYRVNFLSADREKEFLIIRYEEVRPRGFVTQALTTPCLLKVLPRPGGPEPEVIFERTIRQRFPNEAERRR